MKIFWINRSNNLNVFTLIELLVVLVIVGILVLLALPNLTPLISRAKSTEAQIQLEHLHTLQKSHFYLYATYAGDFDALGFEQEKTVDEGGRANYSIEILHADKKEFLARAIAVADFDGDGVLNEWQIDQEKRISETVRD